MKTRRKEILGELIRRERVIRRINQETLGAVVGLGKTAISAYERGVASPDIEKLDAMCTFMNVDYIELLREPFREGVEHLSLSVLHFVAQKKDPRAASVSPMHRRRLCMIVNSGSCASPCSSRSIV